MNFNIKIWHKYRHEAANLANHIETYKTDEGIILLEKKVLKAYIQQITDILKECTDYMNKCGMTIADPLWKYNEKHQNTHASNKSFIYKDRMSKKLIKDYGYDFMKLPFRECREG